MSEINHPNHSLFAFVRGLFSRRKKSNSIFPKVSFHTEDVQYGTHGYLKAACPQRGIGAPCSVRFVFVGLSHPPAFTPEVFAHIYAEAANAGFQVEFLESYGLRSRTPVATSPKAMLSDACVTAENGSHRRSEHYSTLAMQHFPLPSKIQAPAPDNQKQNKGIEHGLYV